MDKSEKFWDKKAEKYSKAKIADQETYEKKLEITRSYMKPGHGGAGTGLRHRLTALLHAPYVKHIRATDFSQNMVDIACAKAADQGITNVTFERATVEEPGQPDASVDMVLALNLLHLVEDWQGAIRDAYRMLKPGGIYVTSTACLSDSMSFMRPIIALGMWLVFFPTVEFSPRPPTARPCRTPASPSRHEWMPGGMKAVFMVARKPGGSVVSAGDSCRAEPDSPPLIKKIERVSPS